jgi:hypothetical protein
VNLLTLPACCEVNGEGSTLVLLQPTAANQAARVECIGHMSLVAYGVGKILERRCSFLYFNCASVLPISPSLYSPKFETKNHEK